MASIEDLKRLCSFYIGCINCPLFINGTASCTPNELPNNAEKIINKWVAEHPVKTYAMDFFSKFPDAQRKATTGIPIPCIGTIYSEFRDKDCPVRGCSECWNREMKEDD